MIQLFVNNREVILPEDFSLTLIEENPLITRNGEFTLDITSSLLEPANAVTFGFLNRLNKSSIPKDATAYLIVDGKVRNGKIVLLNNNDVEVNYQFIAGNSELNYIAKTDTKIWELDWGTEAAPITYARALQTIANETYVSGSFHYVCTPVLLNNDVVVNNFTLSTQTNSVNSTINGVTGNMLIQPYLLYYIDRLPGLLGYTLKNNVLEDDSRALRMFIVNNIDSLSYADFLPDMTISDFIEAVENFFNVVFIVNSIDKTISIENLKHNIESKNVVVIDDILVLDQYHRSFSQDENALLINHSKIAYDLDDDLFYKWARLDKKVYDKCVFFELNTFQELYDYVLNVGGYVDRFAIYHDKEMDNDYIYVSANYINGAPAILFYSTAVIKSGDFDFLRIFTLINKLSDVGNSEDDDLLLKIIPAKCVSRKVQVNVNISAGTGFQYLYTQCPSLNKDYQLVSLQEGLIKTVQEGSTAVQRDAKMVVALYTGKISSYHADNIGFVSVIPATYPYSHIDFLPEFSALKDKDNLYYFRNWVENTFKPKATTTLKLKGPGGILNSYHQQSIVISDIEYEFSLLPLVKYDVNDIFMINNQKYIAKRFEYEKTKIQKTVKGYFFRLL